MSDTRSKMMGWGLWEVALIAVLALAFRLIHLEEVRHTDSYFHIMAAAAWLNDGTLYVGGDVPYTRAYLFTYLVAGFQSLFGGTTFVAGLPAILAGVAWVATLFLWVRSVAGRAAAWVAGLLLCFDMGSLALAHMVRFYTLHGLLFFLAAIGVYYLVTRRPPWGVATLIGGAALVSLSLAYHLQFTTVIGGIALVVWLLVEGAPYVVRSFQDHRSRAIGVAIAVSILVLVAVMAVLQTDFVSKYWSLYRGAPPMWAESRADAFHWYFVYMESNYTVLWALFPLVAMIAIARYGRPAIFAVVLFMVPFILHSMASFKAERFLSYAMPFFFATWGMAIAAVFPGLERIARDAVPRIIGIRPAERLFAFATWGLSILLVIAIVVTNRPIWKGAYKFVVDGERPGYMSTARWDEAASLLKPVLDSVEVVVVGAGEAYYYLDHVHVITHSKSGLGDQEFVREPVLGVPMISTGTSLETLFRCYNSGVVATDTRNWGKGWMFTEEIIEVLQANTQPIFLPEEWGIRAYLWSHDEKVVEQGDCPVLESRRAPRL